MENHIIGRSGRTLTFIAANGLLILLPLAFYLESKASAGAFDNTFYILQVIELIAGATNLFLMGLSIRDGRTMGNRKRLVVTEAKTRT